MGALDNLLGFNGTFGTGSPAEEAEKPVGPLGNLLLALNAPGQSLAGSMARPDTSNEHLRFTTASPLVNITNEDIDRGVNIGMSAGPGSISGKLANIPIRDAGAQIGHEGLRSLTQPGHFYRAMTNDEYAATLGAGKGIKSNQSHSVTNEGTSFAYDAPTAESYANYGRTDPRKTGEPTWLVQVAGQEGLTPTRDGYLKAAGEIPRDRINRLIKMEPKDGAIVGSDVPLFKDDIINIVRKYAAAGIAVPPAIMAQYQKINEQQ